MTSCHLSHARMTESSCMCANVRVCVYVGGCTYAYTRKCECASVFEMYVWYVLVCGVCVSVRAVYVCMYVCLYVCVCACVCVCVVVCLHVCVCVCVRVCVYIYIYIYIYQRREGGRA